MSTFVAVEGIDKQDKMEMDAIHETEKGQGQGSVHSERYGENQGTNPRMARGLHS